MSEEDPKIIIDSDWKEEAQKEKESLAGQEPAPGEEGPPPDAQFLEIVNMISMQAAIGMGGFKTPDGRIIPPDMHAAKHHIDLLEILLEKTQNNLDEKESTILTATLHELRMAYVQIAAGGVDPAVMEGPDAGAAT